jgi:Protein of unknown function (DUF998)
MTTSGQPSRPSPASFAVVAVLCLSALALAIAPAFMPAGYDWMGQTTSESGAQALAGAWVARLGFLTFGLAVILLTVQARVAWPRGAVWLHAGFGIAMTATAAFSHRPWSADVPFDAVEDALHSLAATGMGFAFAGGVVVRLVQRRRQQVSGWELDLAAVLAATLLPLAMRALPAQDGLLQRTMMLIAYLWYAREALRLRPAAT